MENDVTGRKQQVIEREQKAIEIATRFDGMPIEEARAILARAMVLLGSNQIFSADRIKDASAEQES